MHLQISDRKRKKKKNCAGDWIVNRLHLASAKRRVVNRDTNEDEKPGAKKSKFIFNVFVCFKKRALKMEDK